MNCGWHVQCTLNFRNATFAPIVCFRTFAAQMYAFVERRINSAFNINSTFNKAFSFTAKLAKIHPKCVEREIDLTILFFYLQFYRSLVLLVSLTACLLKRFINKTE